MTYFLKIEHIMRNLIVIISFCILLSSCKKKDPVQFALTTSVSPTDGGTVNPSSGLFKEGESVELTAIPTAGYLFAGWSDGGTGTANPLTVVMNLKKSISANFEKMQYSLTINYEGDGTVKEEVVQTKSLTNYSTGTKVKLTAVAKSGSEFIGWSGDYTGLDNPYIITVDKSKAITAKFKANFKVLSYVVKINIPGVNNTQIQSAAYNVSGMTPFSYNNVGYILLSGSNNDQENGPLIQLKKENDTWKFDTSYPEVSMGMARNYEITDGGSSIAYADQGKEYGDPWPYGHLYFGRFQSGNIKWAQVSTVKSFYHSVSTGDLNNDGLADVVGLHMGTKGSWTNDNLHPYAQNNDGSFSENRNIISTSNWAGNHGAGAVLVKDLFGDGYPEIIRADYGFNSTYQQPSDRYSIVIFSFNQATGKYEISKNPGPIGVFSNPDRGATSIKAIDFDKDGHLDLAIATEGTNYSGIEIWKQDGQGNFVPTNQRLEFTNNEMQFREFEVMDVDNDGYEDIVINPFHYGNMFRIDPVWWNPDASKGISLQNFIWKNNAGNFELYKGKDLTIPNVNPDYCKAYKVNGDVVFVCIRSGSLSSNEITVTEIYVDFK